MTYGFLTIGITMVTHSVFIPPVVGAGWRRDFPSGRSSTVCFLHSGTTRGTGHRPTLGWSRRVPTAARTGLDSADTQIWGPWYWS